MSDRIKLSDHPVKITIGLDGCRQSVYRMSARDAAEWLPLLRDDIIGLCRTGETLRYTDDTGAVTRTIERV
jgi:hypothetical protein